MRALDLPTPLSDSAFVTIVSANYLPAARVLCRSLEEWHPDVRRFVILVDRPMSPVIEDDEPFETIPADALGISSFDDFMAQYSVMEANTAVKPFALRHLFERYGVASIVYLDPDIWVQAPLEPVFQALRRSHVVL